MYGHTMVLCTSYHNIKQWSVADGHTKGTMVLEYHGTRYVSWSMVQGLYELSTKLAMP